MPRLCAFGCYADNGITMHSFPNQKRFPDRFKAWVSLVGGKLETKEDYEWFKKKKVCDIHFSDKHRNRFRRLNAMALPTLHLCGRAPKKDHALENKEIVTKGPAPKKVSSLKKKEIVEKSKAVIAGNLNTSENFDDLHTTEKLDDINSSENFDDINTSENVNDLNTSENFDDSDTSENFGIQIEDVKSETLINMETDDTTEMTTPTKTDEAIKDFFFEDACDVEYLSCGNEDSSDNDIAIPTERAENVMLSQDYNNIEINASDKRKNVSPPVRKGKSRVKNKTIPGDHNYSNVKRQKRTMTTLANIHRKHDLCHCFRNMKKMNIKVKRLKVSLSRLRKESLIFKESFGTMFEHLQKTLESIVQRT